MNTGINWKNSYTIFIICLIGALVYSILNFSIGGDKHGTLRDKIGVDTVYDGDSVYIIHSKIDTAYLNIEPKEVPERN